MQMECALLGNGGYNNMSSYVNSHIGTYIGAQSVAVEWLALPLRIRNLPDSNTSANIQFVRGFPQCLETGHDHFLPHLPN
jgi:hypothetical protein